MKVNLLLLMFLLGLVACSSNNDSEGETGLIIEDEEILVGEEDFILDEEKEEMMPKGSEVEISSENLLEEDTSEEFGLVSDQQDSMEQSSGSSDIMDIKYSYYQVQKGDTLMLIAFKMYGDYMRWHELYELNRDTLNNSTQIQTGSNLKYQVPQTEFSWNPEGNPYLIVQGDTLGKISNKVYNTPSYWKNIYENNRPIIRDPNLIFAGFTIYYTDLNRELSSEQ